MTTATLSNLLDEQLAEPAKLGAGNLIAAVREGLPAETLVRLAERFELSQTELSAKLGIPLRTLNRRIAQHGRLTASESDRAVRMAQVFADAAQTLGSEQKAAQWLKTPNRALDGVRPLDLLDTDPGVREVEQVLGRIAYGVYS